MTSIPVVEISSRAAQRLRKGHVWVFRSDLRDSGGGQAGDLVHVKVRHSSGGCNWVGTAFYNPESVITLRMITREMVQPDRAFWRERLAQALQLRERIGSGDTAGRLVYSEADTLPGLIVDRYADVLVLQTLCAGTDRLRDVWVELLGELVNPRAIVERNDYGSRKLEGLAERVGVLTGELAGPVEILEGGLQLVVDPLGGQKTGQYLDQRENRKAAGQYARGRCLDVFCFQGGFGLQLKKAGAERVILVDQSERALELAKAAATRNGLEVETRAANGFDILRELQTAKERFDLVVLDPPAFAKNRAAVAGATRGYKDINLRAMDLLVPGGVLITSSCSYHMTPDRFEEVVLDAAQDAGRVVQVIERRSQARDHPERLGFPESHYLKCLFLRIL